tara:strand:+ start:1618 stop:1812 length:195 start_codon:yes stop_codon:yes gene_type:complete
MIDLNLFDLTGDGIFNGKELLIYSLIYLVLCIIYMGMKNDNENVYNVHDELELARITGVLEEET